MCMVESLWCPPEAITLSVGYTPVQNKMFKEKNVLIQSIELPPYDPAIPLLGICPRGMENLCPHKYL